MKTLFWARCIKRDMLIVGSICLLLLSAAKGQTSYTITDLGSLGGFSSFAYGINNSGQIVGVALITGNSAFHAFLYSGGHMLDLGTLGGSYGDAYGINNSGQIVGEAGITGDFATHAFLYSAGQLQDLNNFLAPNSGWILSAAYGINDSGHIVGSGRVNNALHAYLLTPASVRP
jgi:probable HAF family extracellular repeat protein